MSQSAATTADLMTVEDLATFLGRTPASIRQMVHAGNLPASAKIGRRRYWRRATVVEWLDRKFEAASA